MTQSFSGVTAVVYLDENPKKFAVVQTVEGFSLPGGAIESMDTSPEAAMYREIHEELGPQPEEVELQTTDFTETFVYGRNKKGRAGQKVTRTVWIAKCHQPNLNPVDPEVLGARWLTAEQALATLTWDNAKETLAKCLNIL